jgi:hypothetical protein
MAAVPVDGAEMPGDENLPRVFLKVTVADGAVCRFSYSVDGRTFTSIGDPFTARAGRWVGAKVGLFAAATPAASRTGRAIVDWFRIAPSGSEP